MQMEKIAKKHDTLYSVMDMFMRIIPMERIELNWDGERMTMAEGTELEGTVRLQWNGEPYR